MIAASADRLYAHEQFTNFKWCYEVLSALRRDGDNVPVLILSAKTEIDDKIQGFTTGADDYMTKPFEIRELLMLSEA